MNHDAGSTLGFSGIYHGDAWMPAKAASFRPLQLKRFGGRRPDAIAGLTIAPVGES